ncbi:MAG: hypothetical protein FJY95_04200 [Candidatus Handelsmanbacteria bacterium]|nr:hypothetical protein [Candidatus Handelsmanbacteria bacterium]
MRKKIGFALAAILTVAALQWAVASVDTQPAATQQVVTGTTKVSAAACPTKGEATATSASATACPKDKAGCDKASTADCPKGEAAANTTSTSASEVDCTKAEGGKCPYNAKS